jgi:hypothetical protein
MSNRRTATLEGDVRVPIGKLEPGDFFTFPGDGARGICMVLASRSPAIKVTDTGTPWAVVAMCEGQTENHTPGDAYVACTDSSMVIPLEEASPLRFRRRHSGDGGR